MTTMTMCRRWTESNRHTSQQNKNSVYARREKSTSITAPLCSGCCGVAHHVTQNSPERQITGKYIAAVAHSSMSAAIRWWHIRCGACVSYTKNYHAANNSIGRQCLKYFWHFVIQPDQVGPSDRLISLDGALSMHTSTQNAHAQCRMYRIK